MPRQQHINPQRRDEDEGGVYDQPGNQFGGEAARNRAHEASQKAGSVIDDIDSLLDQEKNPDGESSQAEPEESSSESSDVANTEELASAETGEAAGDEISFSEEDATRIQEIRALAKKHKKGIITGAVAGLLIGGGFGFFTMISGPLQFLKIAHDMESFHFSHLQNQSDKRTAGLFQDLRRAKSLAKGGKDWERTRMGFIGNKVADKIEAKLAASGIKYVTSPSGFVTTHVELDTSKMPELEGKTPEEASRYVQDKYGVKNISIEGKTLKINITDMSSNPLKFNSLNRFILKNAGYSALSQRIGLRFLDARFNLTWHYMKKALNKKIGETAEAFKERMSQNQYKDITEGNPSDIKVQSACSGENAGSQACKKAKEESDKEKKLASQRASEGSQTASEANSAKQAQINGTDPEAGGFKAKISAKLTGGAVALVGVLCILKSINDDYNSLKIIEVVAPLIRFATKFISLGSQIKDGSDVDNNQLAYYSTMLYDNNPKSDTDPYGGTNWTQSQAQNAEEINAGVAGVQLNKDGSVPGVPLDATLQNIKKTSPLAWTDNGILKGVCSTVGQWAITFLGGPFSIAIAAVMQIIPGINELIGNLINMAAGWMLGTPVTPFPQGAQTGNYLNVGTRLAANAQNISAGAGALSQQQVAQLDKDEEGQQMDQFASNSFTDRIFDPYLDGSVTNKIATGMSPGLSANITNVASDISGVFGSLIQSLSSLINKPSYAAGSINLEKVYGFPEYGFSDEEVEKAGDPLDNAIKAADLLDKNCTEKGNIDTSCSYIKKAKSCFDVNITATKYNGENQWDAQPDPTSASASGSFDPYGSSYPSDCGSDSPDWLSIRFFIFDTETMKALGCYDGDSGSCADLGYNSGSATTDGTTGSNDGNIALVSGDSESLAKQILNNQNITLSASAKNDIQATADGQPAQPGPDGNGSSGASGRSGCQPVNLNPALLQTALSIAQKYKYQINDIVSGHQCDSAQHPKGRAMDIFYIGGQPLNDNWWANNSNVATVNDIGNIVHNTASYTFGFGVGCSAVNKIQNPGNLVVFNDSCNPQDEIHIDVRGAP